MWARQLAAPTLSLFLKPSCKEFRRPQAVE